MRLIRLYVDHYRVLHELPIDFDRGVAGERQPDPQQGYALDFLAGVNGTGKSTILHLLGKLFARLLSEDYYFPVPIELSYTLRTSEDTETVFVVTNMPDEGDENGEATRKLRYRVDNGDWHEEKMRPEHLPRHIVIYTTGSEQAWMEALREEYGREAELVVAGLIAEEQEDEAYLQELPGHRHTDGDYDQPVDFDFDNPFLFVHSERLPLVALCGLIASRHYQAANSNEVLHPVLESIGLEELQGFSLRLRAHRSLTPPAQLEIIDDRLAPIADHTIQRGGDRLFVFNMAAQIQRRESGEQSIFSIYDSPIELFQRLNGLYSHRPFYDPPLQEVNLFLHRLPPKSESDERQTSVDSMLHLFDWLSDGEQSFLGRMALFALFRADNLLILLDEPEVHFNDVWKREIVNMLDKIMQGHASHAVITTHSSIALSDVRPQDILVLRRQEQLTQGREAVRPPEIQTLGADPSDILVHVFGTRSASGERGVRFIREEIGRRNTVEELQELEDSVAPGYWRYRIQLEARRMQSNLQQ